MKEVYIVDASSTPDLIDPAILRQGGIDKMLEYIYLIKL